MSQPNEIFLSHSSFDHAFVGRLADVLRQHGVPIWYSGTNILGAQQWRDEIGTALSRCDRFIVILSPDAVSSNWVKRELMYALRQTRMNERIVPVLYRSCNFDDLSWTLGSIQMIDFRIDFEQGCRELLRIWGIGFAAP